LRTSSISSSGDEQEHRAFAFLRQLRLGGDLVGCWTEFLHMLDREPGSHQKVEGSSHRAMMLHDPFGKPIGRPRPFHEVAVEGPCFPPLGVGGPARIRRAV
jgi:hypothetical protein